MQVFRVIILDFDGVVIESNDVKTHAFQRVFMQFPEHLETMMNFHHTNVSLSRFAKFARLQQLLGRQGDEVFLGRISAEFSNYVRQGMQGAQLVPGAESFLAYAQGRWPVYLASVTPQKELEETLTLRDLAKWFVRVYGCPPWTKSDAILDILKRESLQKEDAILIGDSVGDQRAAALAGIRFLARNSGLPFEEPFPEMFTDLNQVEEFFKELQK